MPPPRLTIADYLQRGVVFACLGLTGYGGLLIVHGFTVRMMRRRDEAHEAAVQPITFPEQVEGTVEIPKTFPS